jgi:hypothetical protein
MANEKIWRLNSLLLGKETTAGTEASTFIAIPLTSVWYIKPVVEYIDNEAWYWRIESLTEKTLVKKMSETSLEWRAGTTTFWHLLTAMFGQSSAPTLVETWVYKHSFTILNNNNHKSYSIVTDWVAQELSLYNLLDKLSLKWEVWQVLTFSAWFKGKIWVTTTWKTVSFVTESPFKVCEMTVKFATNTAWLTWASATKLTNINFEIAKNVTEIMEIGGLCEPTSLHNQQFGITWDMELLYRWDDTFKGYNANWTNQAMRITITWSTLIWATKYNELNFDFDRLSFDEWDRSNSNDELISQTVWFTALYSLSSASMFTAYIQNSQSTQY